MNISGAASEFWVDFSRGSINKNILLTAYTHYPSHPQWQDVMQIQYKKGKGHEGIKEEIPICERRVLGLAGKVSERFEIGWGDATINWTLYFLQHNNMCFLPFRQQSLRSVLNRTKKIYRQSPVGVIWIRSTRRPSREISGITMKEEKSIRGFCWCPKQSFPGISRSILFHFKASFCCAKHETSRMAGEIH